MSLIKLANNKNHKTLVIWATDCAQRVLPYFEDIHVNDNRPRNAIEAGQAWIRGEISVHDVRQAAFAAHYKTRAQAPCCASILPARLHLQHYNPPTNLRNP